MARSTVPKDQTDMLAEIGKLGNIECGEEAAKHFAFEDGYRNLNHGSYGTYPIEVRSVLRRYQEKTEARPDTFIRYEYRTHLLDASREAIAKYLHAPLETCVLVPNTSHGIDTILRTLVYEPNDVIICFSTIYGSFDNTLQYLTETTSVSVKVIEITYPTSHDFIIAAFETAVREISSAGKVAKIALYDTISSLPGVLMPYERLTRLCRTYNILSCIDGAHGIGHLPLHLKDLDADFFVTNCHKWLFVPRGCAVLYAPIRNQRFLVATFPAGFDFVPVGKRSADATGRNNGFVANFASLATLDDTPYLCIPAALAWRGKVSWGGKLGDEAIVGYISYIAHEGGALVAKILGTEVLTLDEDAVGKCCMANVRLPLSFDKLEVDGDDGKADAIGAWVMRTVNLEHDIAVNVFRHGDAWWVRLSAQIYLTLGDFEHAGKALKETCARVTSRSWDRQESSE